ncbi:hypothetical protein ABT403_26005 [Streptomyces sp. NPDC000075]
MTAATALAVQRVPAIPHLPPVLPAPAPAPTPAPAPAPRIIQRAEPTPRTAHTENTAHPAHNRPRPPAPADGTFNPRSLTEFQLDELAHRLIGRITRQLRTELRLDRERVGKLRDPRN